MEKGEGTITNKEKESIQKTQEELDEEITLNWNRSLVDRVVIGMLIGLLVGFFLAFLSKIISMLFIMSIFGAICVLILEWGKWKKKR